MSSIDRKNSAFCKVLNVILDFSILTAILGKSFRILAYFSPKILRIYFTLFLFFKTKSIIHALKVGIVLHIRFLGLAA